MAFLFFIKENSRLALAVPINGLGFLPHVERQQSLIHAWNEDVFFRFQRDAVLLDKIVEVREPTVQILKRVLRVVALAEERRPFRVHEKERILDRHEDSLLGPLLIPTRLTGLLSASLVFARTNDRCNSSDRLTVELERILLDPLLPTLRTLDVDPDLALPFDLLSLCSLSSSDLHSLSTVGSDLKPQNRSEEELGDRDEESERA
ncbi:MAG: hypothetical protein G01um10142_524 [Parcubacteria group bacterium Gr01-1014_2]|nr:MAG: hypothetical protein G01um10142_524 [Parcubacteria group bacterium Gr01-1014_2]